MEHTLLTNLSPLDGRYADKLNDLRPFFSEFGLIHYRVLVEIRWLQTLSKDHKISEIHKFSGNENDYLNAIVDDFSLEEALKVKAIEAITHHDVKAVEYYIKDKLKDHPTLKKCKEMVHFVCTSEDINNLAYGVILQRSKHNIFLPVLTSLTELLNQFAEQYAYTSMLARTHGQAATPTTLGKEFANFCSRLDTQARHFASMPILGKFNGAVGNFNAHVVAYPHVNWRKLSKNFVESLGLAWNEYTTQIEPHDQLAALLHALARINTILIDLSRDMWAYISLGYFQQKTVAGEIGSSTMPHKINPIDFENAEGNLGLANALIHHLCEKLPISRWQRDLSDSTVLRNLGVVFGHSLIAYDSLTKGLNRLTVNEKILNADLNNNWQVLAEAIQTVMRKHGLPDSYEDLLAMTRGKEIEAETLREFIYSLNLPEDAKAQLLALTPQSYIGLAAELAKDI